MKAIRLAAMFTAGSLILTEFPKRPGVARRIALLGVSCGSRYLRDRGETQFQHNIHDAFQTPLHAPERVFWRSVASVIYDGAVGPAWRESVRKLAPTLARVVPEFYADLIQSTRYLEKLSLTRGSMSGAQRLSSQD